MPTRALLYPRKDDLTYEGIETCFIGRIVRRLLARKDDLTYEGIETFHSGHIIDADIAWKDDLTYEGIETVFNRVFNRSLAHLER